MRVPDVAFNQDVKNSLKFGLSKVVAENIAAITLP
jgi:hypothetical protein